MAYIGKVDAVAIGVATGEATPAGGAADRGGGVPSIENDTLSGHGVQLRGLGKGMILIPHVRPAVIVRHAEDDVGAGVFCVGKQ